MINPVPRVRFAPSPTGYLHVGGLRTALYNYLFAKNCGGQFILRIEDTDRNRYVEGAVEKLIEALKWVNIDYDEGPDKKGNYGPYMQSERLDIYKKYVLELVEKKHAYYCFCTPERLQSLKEEQQRQKLPQAKYDKHCLHLTKEEIDNNLKSGMNYVIRLNVTEGEKISFQDIVRDRVEFDRENIDDQVLIKSDGYPTYHLANVVDDHLMKITHVIRGEEWLSSTPKHILLYDYFGWEKPVFAHLPLLLNPDRSKLSKRQGDVAVEDYKDKGYLKEALINFVALLGWSAGDNQEIYCIDELIKKFSLERVNKSGAVFDQDKLKWLNEIHLRSKPDNEIIPIIRESLKNNGFDDNKFSDEYLGKIISSMKERVSFPQEYVLNCRYFYEAPAAYDNETAAKRWKEDSPKLMQKLIDEIEKLDNPEKHDYENALATASEITGSGKGNFIHPLRLSVSGTGSGPGVYDILDIIGKNETIKRIKKAIAVFS